MKKTALNEIHHKLGARMVPFAGYEMPVRYTSDIEEHITVREKAGVFDVSHMGVFMVKGPEALELIQKVSSNDATKLSSGKVQYACMPNEQGGIVDDLLVYMLKEDEYMLVVNASNIEKDWDWVNSHNSMGAITENISEDISILAVQGPDAEKVLQKITSADLSKIPFYGFTKGNIGDITDGVVISATGYTGSGGFELYMYNQYAAQIWEALMGAGEAYGIKPAGLGARDTLRLEMGYCLYGNDIDDTTSPIEAGLGWITSLNKSFIGVDIFRQQKESGVKKKLCGFVMQERGIPRHGYKLLNSQDEEIGEVTSGTMSPSLNMGIGMGYVRTEYARPGEIIQVSVRNKKIPAKITKLPFYKP